MELHELHVAQLGPGAPGDGQAVAGGDLGIGRFAKHLAAAAGAENRLLGPDERFAVLGIPDQRAAASAVVREQIDRERVFPDLHVRQIGSVLDDGPHHFFAGGIAQGMHDAIVAVAPFAAQREFAGFQIEVRAPVDQLANALRGVADDHFDDLAIAQLAAGRERVGDVIFEAIFRIEHAGDAPLGVGAVRLSRTFPS